MDRCTPAMPGRNTSGFSPTRQALLTPSSKRREVFGESHEGGGGGKLAPCGQTCEFMVR